MTVPWIQSLYLDADPVAAANDLSSLVGKAPFAGSVVAVEYEPSGAMTTNGATNIARQFTLYNRSSGGAGSVVVAQLTTGSANTLADNVPKVVPLSTVTSAQTVAAGDTLEWESLHSGATGIADPGGKVRVDISRS
jgi:hypothetical protein